MGDKYCILATINDYFGGVGTPKNVGLSVGSNNTLLEKNSYCLYLIQIYVEEISFNKEIIMTPLRGTYTLKFDVLK